MPKFIPFLRQPAWLCWRTDINPNTKDFISYCIGYADIGRTELHVDTVCAYLGFSERTFTRCVAETKRIGLIETRPHGPKSIRFKLKVDEYLLQLAQVFITLGEWCQRQHDGDSRQHGGDSCQVGGDLGQHGGDPTCANLDSINDLSELSIVEPASIDPYRSNIDPLLDPLPQTEPTTEQAGHSPNLESEKSSVPVKRSKVQKIAGPVPELIDIPSGLREYCKKHFFRSPEEQIPLFQKHHTDKNNRNTPDKWTELFDGWCRNKEKAYSEAAFISAITKSKTLEELDSIIKRGREPHSAETMRAINTTRTRLTPKPSGPDAAEREEIDRIFEAAKLKRGTPVAVHQQSAITKVQ